MISRTRAVYEVQGKIIPLKLTSIYEKHLGRKSLKIGILALIKLHRIKKKKYKKAHP